MIIFPPHQTYETTPQNHLECHYKSSENTVTKGNTHNRDHLLDSDAVPKAPGHNGHAPMDNHELLVHESARPAA